MEAPMKTLAAAAIAAFIGTGCAAAALNAPPSGKPPKADSPSVAAALANVSSWPNYSRDLAGALIDEYGAPDEVQPERMTWIERTPWKRVIVYRVDSDHPKALSRSVSYAVPLTKWRALEAFGHGAVYDGVNDELAARTDSQETGFLVLNLANEVIRGRLSPDDASALYDKTLTLLYSGKSSPYTSALLFNPN
jgi:hypothetical protein